jgi:hypothetical protein
LQSTKHSLSPRTLGEIVTMLNGAVDEAKRLKTEQLGTSTMYLLDDVAIPPETARGWVDSMLSRYASTTAFYFTDYRFSQRLLL